MTTRLPLPPLPDLPDITPTGRPVLDHILTELAARPTTTRAAFYDDSPYIPPTEPEEQRMTTAADRTAPDPEPDEKDDGPWCAAPRP